MSSTDDESNAARQRILEAVFRLVEHGGVPEASLRKVATESCINIGSVRHYFGSHETLMVAAAEEVGARMQHRLDASSHSQLEPQDAAGQRKLLEHVAYALLPTAVEQRGELVVLMEFIAAARIRPEFQPLATRMGHDMRVLIRHALKLARIGDIELETERFVALLEGLTFEQVYPRGSAKAPIPQDIIRRHIAALVPG